ncbi:MAG: UDP-3-O-acylglucosamine N-acyltransferase [Isosphaeraceae bacterium]|nr:MAG: UDP-3-O-acylglucosamine N-acyltransferase [Isosphaeraceae bacterium]
MTATVSQLASLVRGRVVGDGSLEIRGARPLAEAGPGDITFLDDERYAKQLRGSPASAAIIGPHFRKFAEQKGIATIEVDDPLSAFLAIREHLNGPRAARWTGVHPQAYVAPTAQLGRDVAIHPFAYVGDAAVIGDGCTLYPGAVVGARCVLGTGVILHPHVVLYDDTQIGARTEIHAGSVIGGDGFGYRLQDGRHVKVPQTGRVVIGEDVEIGANCTIDRGTFEATEIGDGSKIDNLVMIGHNNKIGRHNILCGQVGIAGSCKTGDYVVMAGQAGIKDHVEIGDRAIVGAQAGVHRNVPAGQQVLGSPAIPIKEQRHIFAMIARLPDMHRQLRELSAQVALLMAAPEPPPTTVDNEGY